MRSPHAKIKPAKSRLNFWCGRRECNSHSLCSWAPFTALRLFRTLSLPLATLSGSLPSPHAKIKPAKCRLNFWCGRRESNPRLKLGKLSCCHYTTPANKLILQNYFTKVQKFIFDIVLEFWQTCFLCHAKLC